jgi:uncharacterized protein
MTAEDIIAALGLEPHPKEGGFFREIYRATGQIPASSLPDHFEGTRCYATAIYYLLTPGTFSHLHTVASDEIFHFYLGDPVDMLQLHSDGRGEHLTLGSDLLAGQSLTVTVPRGVWQGCRLHDGGSFALMGCTVAPGFEYQDYRHADRSTLLKAFPQFTDEITKLTFG